MSNKIDVGISATDAGFTSTIKKVNDSTKTLDDSVKKVASNVTASFGSMVKAGAALAVGFGAIKLAGAAFREVFEGFGEALDLGGELNDLASRTGETAGNILVLQRAFDNAGSSAEKVGPSINKMQKFLDDAAQGAAKNTEVLGRLGVSMVELQGKTPTEQMRLLAERISAIKEPTERGALAMAVFGKSGGELLPLLRNFSGELQTAQSQLGSMPGVIDRSNAAFDTISDNIAVIQTKFRDLAAGLLDRLAPALEFATTMLTRFDAAALGMKIGDILIGAGEGMKGFTDALKSISMGEFGIAWQIAFTSAKLTAAESFNSILNNARAALAAIAEFAKVVLGPGSGMWTIITGAFDLAGSYLAKSIGEGLKTALGGLPIWGDTIAKNIGESLSVIDAEIASKSKQMKNAMGQIPDDLLYGMDQAGKVFDETLSKSKDLIDTSGMQKQLESDRLELKRKTLEYLQQEIAEQNKAGDQNKQSVSTAAKIAELEREIVQAKKDGNVERERELEASKAYYVALEKALKDGKSLEDAVNDATRARSEYIQQIANKQNEVTGELKEQTIEMAKQLSLSEQLQKTLDDAVKKEQIDPGGKTENKINEAIARGDFTKAQRDINKLFDQEIKASAKDLFAEYKKMQKFEEQKGLGGDFKDIQREAEREQRRAMRMSPQDMAKELGIETGEKKRSELIDEINEELKKRKQQKDDPTKKGEKEAEKVDKQTEQANALKDIVQKIHDLCAKIEPKLPQTALGF